MTPDRFCDTVGRTYLGTLMSPGRREGGVVRKGLVAMMLLGTVAVFMVAAGSATAEGKGPKTDVVAG